MITLITSQSGKPAVFRTISDSKFLNLIRKALLPCSEERLKLGLIYGSAFRSRICSGTGTDGSAWGYALAGRGVVERECEPIETSRDGADYEIRPFQILVRPFDAILHRRLSSDGRLARRLDLCLPRDACSRVCYALRQRDTSLREFLVEDLLYDWLEVLRSRSYIHPAFASSQLIH